MGNEGAEVDVLDGEGRLQKVRKARKGLLAEYFIKHRKAVLFVGEGNFTFTVAFAALREAWRLKTPPHSQFGSRPSPWGGIISTRLEPEEVPPSPREGIISEPEEGKPVPVLDTVKLHCIKSISDRQVGPPPGFLGPPSASNYICSPAEKIKVITDLPKPEPGHWKYGYDALEPLNEFNASSCANPSIDFSYDAVWFQCPWGNNLPGLIEGFLLNAAEYVKEGELVCVGITNKNDYVHRYCLEKILGAELNGQVDTKVSKEFEFLGPDTDLIYEILSYGYYHESVWTDIHDYILKHHVTLVFQKRSQEDS